MNAPVRRDRLEELEQFRADVREWLSCNCPESQRQPMTPEDQYWGGRRGKFPSEDARLWFERMRDKGWVVPEWPKQYGGQERPAIERVIVAEERALRPHDFIVAKEEAQGGFCPFCAGNEDKTPAEILALLADAYSYPAASIGVS